MKGSYRNQGDRRKHYHATPALDVKVGQARRIGPRSMALLPGGNLDTTVN